MSENTAAAVSLGTLRRGGVSRPPSVGTILRVVFILVALIFSLFPVIWIISAAFNPSGSMVNQTFIPQNVESLDELLTNFNRLFNDPTVPFWSWMFNSLAVSGITTVLTVAMAAVSAYSFSRFRFSGRRALLVTTLLIQVFPNILAMVAIYLMLLQIGRYIPFFALNTHGGLILVYLAGGMGVNVWLMKGFFDTVPRDIDESALVDGATHWQTFRLLIVPLVTPVLAVVSILVFVGTLNEFLLARIILTDREKWTLMVGLFNFVSAEFTNDWGVFAAGSLIAATPVVLLYISLQRYIVGGLTAGAVKG
ncbi:MAG: sugar ABC transporter permease [Anaerolineae bacterium]|nr:sugar ABC transporter permease [Anaerolineae bacterium]